MLEYIYSNNPEIWESVCVYCMSAVQPQHPDEVSLIGSLWDSSAAFHSECAQCQHSALTKPKPKTKDGTYSSLSPSLAHCFSILTHKHSTHKHTHTTISHQNASVSIHWSVLECWDESGSRNYCSLPKCLHPRLPSRIIGCIFPCYFHDFALQLLSNFSFDANMEMDNTETGLCESVTTVNSSYTCKVTNWGLWHQIKTDR